MLFTDALSVTILFTLNLVYLIIEFSQAEQLQNAEDEDVLEVSARLLKQNREAYEVLAK